MHCTEQQDHGLALALDHGLIASATAVWPASSRISRCILDAPLQEDSMRTKDGRLFLKNCRFRDGTGAVDADADGVVKQLLSVEGAAVDVMADMLILQGQGIAAGVALPASIAHVWRLLRGGRCRRRCGRCRRRGGSGMRAVQARAGAVAGARLACCRRRRAAGPWPSSRTR